MNTLPPPLLLSIRLQEDRLVLLLTDFRAVSLHASCSFNSATVSAAEYWSYDELLPGAVGAFLRTTSPRFLSLQLSSNLLGIEWENLLDGTSCLGGKFAVTRQLAVDNEDWINDAQSDFQRLLEPRPTDPTHPTDPTDIASEDHLDWVNHPLALYDALMLPSIDAFYVTAARLKRRLMGAETVPGLPSLFLLPVDQTLNSEAQFAALATVAHLTAALGSSVIMYCVGDGNRFKHQSFFDALLVGLDAGCPVSEAVRQVRCAFPNSPLRLALYGDGMQILAKRREGKERLQEEVQEGVQARDEFALQDSLRQVTVLSFDLVNSTQLLVRLGGEKYSEMLANFHERCLTIIRECGGVSDDPQGDDGVMSYFGYPVAHENAAIHAVGAGLRIAQVMVELSPSWQAQVRVGIATGQVAVKSGQPVGFAVHLAARLQVLACPNSVIISNQTRVLLGSSFVLKAFSQGPEIKGVTEPQVLFEVLGVAPRTVANRPDSGAVRTAFVGRATEFDWLLGQWSSVRNKVGKVIILSGEAGIGKSRLIREFRQHLELIGRAATDLSGIAAANKMIDVQSHFYLELRCHQDSSASAFSSVIDALRFIFRVSAKEDAQSQIQKILNRWRTEPPLPDPQALQIIASLLGITLPIELVTISIAPESLRQRTLDLLVHVLRQASLGTPICMVVEDLQWVDPSTKELVDRLAQDIETWPFLLLLTIRTEADSGWRPSGPIQDLVLRGLSEGTATLLIRQLIDDLTAASVDKVTLTYDVINLVVARSDGVPLYLEESTRMAVDLLTNLPLTSVGPAEKSTNKAPTLASPSVPATLQDLLMARLDQCGHAKTIAQLGAVLGRQFSQPMLEQVSRHSSSPVRFSNVSESLERLTRAGLLIAVGNSNHGLFRFKHALLRDTAYESLWQRDRQRFHQTVALVIEEQFPEIKQHQPELLAHHLAEAGLYTEAISCWELAARRASSTSAQGEAIAHLSNALLLLELLPTSEHRDRVELKLQISLASRYIATEGYGSNQVENAYSRAAALCDTLGDQVTLLKVELGLEGCYFMRADFERALEIARHVYLMTKQTQDAMQKMQALWALANILWHQGEITEALRLMEECLALYKPEHHRPNAVQDPGIMCLCYSSWALWEQGLADAALVRVNAAVNLAIELNHRFSLGQAYGFAACIHLFRGEPTLALAAADNAKAICKDSGFAVWLAHAQMVRGRVLVELGEVASGVEEMNLAYLTWMKTGAQVTVPFYLAMRAEGLIKMARPEAAFELLAQALQTARAHEENYHEAEILRLLGEVNLQLADVDVDQAEAFLREGLLLAEVQEKPAFGLRSAKSLASFLADYGSLEEGIALLETKLAGIAEGFQTADFMTAQRTLQTLRQLLHDRKKIA